MQNNYRRLGMRIICSKCFLDNLMRLPYEGSAFAYPPTPDGV